MKRVTIIIMGAATLCQAMDIILCLDEIAVKKKAKRCGYKTYLDDSDPTLRMEKIWDHDFDYVSPYEKSVRVVAKRAEMNKMAFTAFVAIQLAAATLLTPIKEPSSLIPAPQERFNVEMIDVKKIAPLSIKKVSSCRYDKFLPKNEKRSSNKKKYWIQQPCKR